MKKIVVLLPAMAAICWLGSCKNADDSSDVAEKQNEQVFDNKMEKDAEFAVKAAAGGMMEVELGNLAQVNGSAASVKQFGKTMVADHTAMNNELTAAAQTKSIALPGAPTDEQVKMINDLRAKTGAEFDKDYIDMMVKDHKDDIDLFEKEAEKGNEPDLKTWAGAKLPTLRQHQQMAEGIQEELKKMK